MPPAVEVRNVSKMFRLYHERHQSLKERVVHLRRATYEEFWAIRDADFVVEEGSTVGLLGHNGSGKSTLLKCIAGILQPTRGEIVTRGRLAALLELGAGFHSELTGRENIFLNASILGFSRRDTEARFDEIVAFAELEKFIDMQVRHYSSGMYVRLGFAVAINVDPDILLVDEVLAVGDEAFQRKCLDRVARFQREGRTILFVSHAPDLVRRICDRAIVLDHGETVADGPAGESIRTFRESLFDAQSVAASPSPDPGASPTPEPDGEAESGAQPSEEPEEQDEGAPAVASGHFDREAASTHRVRITGVELVHPGSDSGRRYLLPNEPLVIRVRYRASEPTEDLLFGIAIYDVDGNHLFGTNTQILGIDPPTAVGDGVVEFRFDHVPLLDGTYPVTLAIQTRDEGTFYDWQEQRYVFEVMNPDRTAGRVALPARIEFPSAASTTEMSR